MRIERLFNVLVLGGAAIGLAACSAPSEPLADGGSEEDASAQPDTSTPVQDAQPKPDSSVTPDAQGTPDAQPDGGTVTGDGGSAKTCAELGMPCCWMGDCTTDVA